MSDSEKIIYELNPDGSILVTVLNGDGEEGPFLTQEELKHPFPDRETEAKAEAVENALSAM